MPGCRARVVEFTEEVEPKFSTIEAHDSTGTRVDNGDVHAAPENAKRLAVGLKPLQPGTYKVIWRITSSDTHKTSGSIPSKSRSNCAWYLASVQSDRGRVAAFVRGLFVTALFSNFGACLFRIVIAPAALKLVGGAEATGEDRRCFRIARWSTLMAALVMLAWLVLESGLMADAETAGQALAAIPSVIWSTSFGHILAAQALALLATAIALMIDRRYGDLGAMGFAGIAVLLQAGHSHALAMHQGLLLLSQCIHLLASGAWLADFCRCYCSCGKRRAMPARLPLNTSRY
jgi:hypothetical protein